MIFPMKKFPKSILKIENIICFLIFVSFWV